MSAEGLHVTTETELLALLDAHAQRTVPGSGLSRLVGRAMPQSWRPRARVAATRAVAPMARRKASRLARTTPLRLNIGCGSARLHGWINIDLVGLPVDLAWDLTRPLPFPDDSVDAVFHEHVIEHVPGAVGYRFLKDCHRVLRPGGVMRVVAPDASRYMASYFEPEHDFIRTCRGDRPTPMLALMEEFYSYGHQAVYDEATIALFCRTIGFAEVRVQSFGDSSIVPCPDTDWRATDSFYVEAVK